MSAKPCITFVARNYRDKWSDIERLGVPEEFPERMRSGIDVWPVQTFLELRAAAAQCPFTVAMDARYPHGQPAVAHWDDLKVSSRYWRSYLAVARADRPPACVPAWQVVQSPAQQGPAAFHIPLWPQPGLIPRSAGRVGIGRLGYFGRLSSLPAFLSDPAFRSELQRRGVTFHADERNWRDYSETDACLGLRIEPAIGLATKPPSKLLNAWLAGVPALLGPEPAYRALRASPLDYLEVSSGRDVLAALDRLIGEPGLYEAMVENGRTRARAFDRAAIRRRWIEFLSGPFLEGWARWRATGGGRFPAAGLARQWIATKRYKREEAREARALAAARAGAAW